MRSHLSRIPLSRRDLLMLWYGFCAANMLVWVTTAHAQTAGTGVALGAAGVAASNSGNVASLSKWFTDLVRAAWGFDLARRPPAWVPIVVSSAIGILAVALISIAAGVDLTRLPSAIEAFLAGVFTGGGGAGLLTSTQDVTRQAEAQSHPASEPIRGTLIPQAVLPATPPPLPPMPPPQGAPPPAPTTDPRAAILAACPTYVGIPYQIDPPPDGVHTLDCSLYVLTVYRDAGLPFPPGVRTAEQIRQACQAIHHSETLPGDLVFFERTYDASGPPGPDGLIASHIGISLGAGTLRMWDHNDSRGTAGIADISTDYWQGRFLGVGRHPALVAPLPPAPGSAGLIHAIDVASYQPADLSSLIATTGATHVVVKLYQQIERIGDRTVAADHSRAQIASALANGCSVGGYIWAYADRDPAASVYDGLALARGVGVDLPVLWLDIEPYTDGSMPGVEWIRAAVAACEREGVRAGIYTGAWCWERLHTTEFAHLPLWAAVYDERAVIDVPLYGGWTFASGHQYTSTPVDRNVFLPAVTS